MNRKSLYSGNWFIPGSEKRYPGILKEHKKRKMFTLTIYSNEYIDGSPVSMDFSKQKSNPTIILGDTSDPVTLYKCVYRGTKYISDILHEITYQVHFVFELVHFNSKEDIIIKSARIKIPFLTSWYDGYLSHPTVEDKAIESTVESVAVKDGLDIFFINKILENKKFLSEYYRKYIEFRYSKNTLFDDAMSDWFKFARLMELATSKAIPFDLLWFTINIKNTSKARMDFVSNNEIDCLVKSYVFGSYDGTEKEWIHQNAMIFSNWKVSKDSLNKIIISWFNNEKFYPIYDYYIESNTWPINSDFALSNVMYNNKFLNLIQGLESYHYQLNDQYNADNKAFVQNRQMVYNSIDKPLRIWLNNNLKFPKDFKLQDRLDKLIIRYEKILSFLFDSNAQWLRFFPEDAKNFRHRLSHGNLKETYQGDYLSDLFCAAQLLLCLCILESLGMDDIRTINALRYNVEVGRTIYQIRNSYQKRVDGSQDEL
ncbi:ApeA N-terminal domain 1-containing protein [Hymenobacter metallicola]|uniref:Uncharacterized protein n=1 Tax=Hymenobacter metallicola TaxID=2563114 RepID=A0A4Z0Q1P6_9BACT|nr:HEPN domain-containing protein [Hymenobacter metallicola]TGE23534.1 hypothetical protein E5K02_20325 [Hymenobacter metallicola]